MLIREGQKHTDPTDPDPEHCFQHHEFSEKMKILNKMVGGVP
jgi:hypothetical protein